MSVREESVTSNNCIENNKVYGRYSMGGGQRLSDPDKLFYKIDDSEIIESYKLSMNHDIERAGIPKDKFNNYEVLDVGTGRQAIALYLLGAKKVKHYDISPNQVERMKSYIESNSLQDRLETHCVDLVNYSLPRNSFDFVYLHGIVQHFSHTGLGLRNCMQAVKKGGYLWLYFYRSGTFANFVVYLLRDLFNRSAVDHRELYINSMILRCDGCKPNAFVSSIMDNLFVTYSNLYSAKSYISFVNDCGFEITFSSRLDPIGKEVDHKYASPTVILVCKKVEDRELSQCDVEILSPGKNVNQLDSQIYTQSIHKEIIQTINDYNSLKQALLLNNIPKSFISSLAIKILDYVKNFNNADPDNRHKYLQNIFNNTRQLIKEEFVSI